MNILFRKVKTFFRLEKSLLKLLPEALFFILLAQIGLAFYSFQKLSKSMGKLMDESPNKDNKHTALLDQIGQSINMIANNLPWEAACYPRALCAKWMLIRRKINSTLYLGVKKNKVGITEGHAWLRSGNQIVVGKKGYKKYNIIATYA
jgi:hypothetical protein